MIGTSLLVIIWLKTSSSKLEQVPPNLKKKGIYRTYQLFEFQSTSMSSRNVVNYYSKGVDYYDRRDFAKAIASLNTFIAETDSKKNKDVALAQRYICF